MAYRVISLQNSALMAFGGILRLDFGMRVMKVARPPLSRAQSKRSRIFAMTPDCFVAGACHRVRVRATSSSQ
jgi:hypothetical protein